jgi:PBSX family phage terminase large subunit
VNINFEYRPMRIHEDFHRSTAYERALFGAFGSGKTYAIVAEAIAWCLEQPGIRGVIARKTIPELRDTVEPIFFEMLPAELYQMGEVRRSGGHVQSFTFPNGSTVLFRSLDDWNKHRSLNVGFIAYDEANEIDEETYMGMASRVRQREPTKEGQDYGATEITRRGIWLATNPNGKDWLYRRFVDPMNKQPNTAYFTSTSLDNPHLPVTYVQSLLQYPEPWIQRYVLCQFDDFAGQVYEDWGWDTHVLKTQDLPPDMFTRGKIFWMGMDPGTRSPTAGLWVYVDQPNRRLIGVAEYERNYASATQHAAEWRRIEASLKGRVAWRCADPTIMTTDRGSNMTLYDQYARLGYVFQPGPKTLPARIPPLGQLIHQKRFVVTEACPLTYEAIKNYSWADITPEARKRGEEAPEKIKKDKYTHLTEAAQYACSRWMKPSQDIMPVSLDPMSDEIHRTIRQQIRRKRNRRASHDLGTIRV